MSFFVYIFISGTLEDLITYIIYYINIIFYIFLEPQKKVTQKPEL
jgi:hypothetical protein